MNCSRWKSRPSARASERAVSVLPRPGQVLQQHVPAGEDAGQHELQRLPLADQHGADPVEHLTGHRAHAGDTSLTPVRSSLTLMVIS